MTSDENSANTVTEPTKFAQQIMTAVYDYRFCDSFATFQDGTPNRWCLTHDQSRSYCRRYQDEILTPLIALIEARDTTLADPADRDELRSQLRRAWRQRDEECAAKESCWRSREQWVKRAERAEAEVAELRAIITDAGLETYTPDGSERVAAHLSEQQRIITELRATVARVATLRDRWAILAGQAMNADNREWLDAASKTLRAALDGAGEQHGE